MRKKSFSQNAARVLTGIGISFTAFLLVLGVFLAALTLVKFIRAFLDARFDAIVESAQRAGVEPSLSAVDSPLIVVESPLSPVVSPLSAVEPREPRSDLTFASFSDLFSSTAALDGKGTTMYRDDAATAFMFPPNVEWRESAPGGLTSEGRLNLPNTFPPLPSCIQNSCLSIKGTVLTKNGVPLVLPAGEGEVESVSAEAIGTKWAVGIVRTVPAGASAEAGKRYVGYAYRFDGKTFAPLFPDEGRAFTSEYKGVWGFGGTEDDFLAVYGAYRGKGYRIRMLSSVESGYKLSVSDISWLFDVRIMRGGITPGIIRVPVEPRCSPLSAVCSITWYLFNKERNNRPVFVKLFQNGTDEIVGEADLLGTAPQGFSYLLLSPVASRLSSVESGYMLTAYAESSGTASSWTILDKGFAIPSVPVSVTSVNLNNYTAEVPHILKLGFREFSAGGASVALAVSNQSEDAWEPVGTNNNHSSLINDYWFRNPHGKELQWKMTVTPGTNPAYTPFIGILDLDYEVKRDQSP